MKNTRQNNCDDVVELLVKKYWSESKSELDQKIAQIAQDFISRKLFNSTVRISKQLHTEYEFVQKLIEHIIESLKQDFSHIPLVSCKDKLLSIVEREYKKLIPKTTARLVEGNLAQKGMLENYGKGILAEMEKAKEKIEIQCAISEKEKVAVKRDGEKWYQNRTIQASLIGGIFVLIAAFLTNPLWVPLVKKIGGYTKVGANIAQDTREAKTKRAIQIIPNILSGDLDKSLIELRASKKLRELTPLETGRSISQTPPGTYFFVFYAHLTIHNGNVEDRLNRASVDSYRRSQSYFEIHKYHEDEVILLGYVSDDAAALLSKVDKNSPKEIVLSSSPWGHFRNLGMIPINRIFKSSDREITVTKKQVIKVFDVVIH